MPYRESMDFSTDWLFLPEDQPELDDNKFEPVSLPHANKILTKHKGNDFMEQIRSYRFVSWYRKHFTPDEESRDKTFTLTFHGAATVADVYLNGVFLGSHKGAYTGFSFDITPYLSFGTDNLLSVRVDSTQRKDIPPEGYEVDYCLFGGLVRGVTLTVTDKLRTAWTFVTTPEVSEDSALVRVQAQVENGNDTVKSCTVSTVILTPEGTPVSQAEKEERIPAGNGIQSECTLTVPNPGLWDVDSPFLYTAVTTISENGVVRDRYETSFGIRSFFFASGEDDGNFYLNGRKRKLRGVNRHEQWPWIGRAVPDKFQIADADLIKETGFNAVRCSHYPQNPAFLQRCDEIGLIVLEEAPGWQHIGDESWKEIYKENVREMILRDRNHPSIITWGVRVNESPDDHELYTETTAIAKSLDSTRPTHGVRRGDFYESTKPIEDLFCVNYTYPEKPRFTPFIITEHSMDWWSGNGCPGAPDDKAAAFTDSFASAMDYYCGNNLCAGGFAWCMFDYNNEVNYTNTGHVFYSGVYSMFRLDKHVAHLYRSQKEEPMIYIAHHLTGTGSADIPVYSSCDEAELFADGRSLGRIKPNRYLNLPHPAYVFENVTLPAETLTAVGYINGKKAAEFTRRKPLAPAKLILTPQSAFLRADGIDMTCVTVELVDRNGTRIPDADDWITIESSGPAAFIGESPIALDGGRTVFYLRTKAHRTGTAVCRAAMGEIISEPCEIEIR